MGRSGRSTGNNLFYFEKRPSYFTIAAGTMWIVAYMRIAFGQEPVPECLHFGA